MASVEIIDDPSCSICQNIFTDLMTLKCGHDFCRECITKVLDTQDTNNEDYCCPKCRKRFRSRPELQRFKAFNNNAERLDFGQSERRRPKILCTYCIDLPKVAVKTCLHCEAHVCEDHLKTHSTSPEHVLVEPTNDLKAMKCSIHNKILDYYCTDDDSYICVLCKYDQHQKHQVDKIDEVFKKLKQEKVNIEEKLNNLHEENQTAEENQAVTMEKVDEFFRNIKKQMEDLHQKVLNEMKRQAERSTVSQEIKTLKVKKDEVMSRIIRIEELCNKTDEKHWPLDKSMEEGPAPHSENLRDQAEHFLIPMIIHAALSDMMKMKDNLFPDLHAAGITLDRRTAAKDVYISEDLKSARSTTELQISPKSRGTFPTCRVLSTNMISSGKHYWVVESSPSGNWAIGVCYNSMKKGQGWIGSNDKSWGLKKFYDAYHAQHGGKAQYVVGKPSTNKFGVYVDWEAGRLSIYELCHPTQHLLTFNPTTFTEPLHAVFSVGEDEAQSQLTVL